MCAKERTKKPFYKRWWFWLLVVLFVMGSANDSSKAVQVGRPMPTVISAAPANASPSSSIEIIAGEAGEYGELITLNKDTEFEETYYVYRVPAGTYVVTNTGRYMNQFDVYGDTVYKTDAGWDELSDTFYVKVLDVGESDTIEIGENQIIEIHEPGKYSLKMID